MRPVATNTLWSTRYHRVLQADPPQGRLARDRWPAWPVKRQTANRYRPAGWRRDHHPHRVRARGPQESNLQKELPPAMSTMSAERPAGAQTAPGTPALAPAWAGKRTRLGMLGKVACLEQPRCRTCFLEQPGLVPHRLAPATDRLLPWVLVALGVLPVKAEQRGRQRQRHWLPAVAAGRRQAQTAN